jgi:hypothetical protein
MRCAAATIPGPGARTAGAGGAGRVAGALIAAGLCVAALPALAGPWARGEGDVFLSFTLTGQEERAAIAAGLIAPEPSFSAYAEYGLGNGLTAGLDLGWGEDTRMATAFLRRTFTPPDATWQVALDAGAGMRDVDGQGSVPLVRLGASLGRGIGDWETTLAGIGLGHDGGWISLDAAALLDAYGGEAIWQAELTIGAEIGDRTRGILALKAEEWPGADMMVTVRPSVVVSLGGGTAIQAGLVTRLRGSDAFGATLSLWREF